MVWYGLSFSQKPEMLNCGHVTRGGQLSELQMLVIRPLFDLFVTEWSVISQGLAQW